MTVAIQISLPRPTPKQAAILEHPAKRTVICAGRRAGKTTLAAMIAIERFLEGQKVLLTSTTQNQADAFWDKAKDWVFPLTSANLVYKNETRRLLSMPNGGRIRVKTGSQPDTLRGDDADLIVFDECALLDPAAWFAVAAPMLADRDGNAIFISSPRRRNWFFHLYNQAIANDDGRWQAWHFTTHDNPYLSQAAVEELAGDMTEDMYKQEILAEFLESDGQVFRNVRECIDYTDTKPTAKPCVFGMDWAQVNDYTVIVVFDVERRRVLHIDRFNGVDWALQRGRLRVLYDEWHPYSILAEANSIGGPNIEALQREGLPVTAFTTTAKSKPPLIENLVLDFERNDIIIPPDDILIGELEAYERQVSPSTGRSQYSAPNGLHDDCVMALALASWQARHYGSGAGKELLDFFNNYKGGR